ncbi:hypothetical protein HPP92_022893 [Vanilla planifolia]|uniref:Uncharacterized protein n=1 Tax=Vanilla planifolia TaxID=51239 RepID=A0A835PW82_VANPL|nr:hypothetical protein HPP92_022893 [Vanilla planifolia]
MKMQVDLSPTTKYYNHASTSVEKTCGQKSGELRKNITLGTNIVNTLRHGGGSQPDSGPAARTKRKTPSKDKEERYSKNHSSTSPRRNIERGEWRC